MIFLLNNERVLAEVAELARCRISEILRVEPKNVSVKLELAPGGKIIPEFNVEVPHVGSLERVYIQQGIEEVWLGWAKRELLERLAGLSDRRLIWSKDHGAPEEDTRTSSYTGPKAVPDPSPDPDPDPSPEKEEETEGENGPPEGVGSV